MRKRIICFLCLCSAALFAFSSAAESRTDSARLTTILSPVPGTWSNYQSLILDVPPDAVAFYSFTGEDPLYSGFAYDGPVLIEKDGPVTLRIATVAKDDSSMEQTIAYSVSLKPSDEQFYLRSLKSAFIPLSSANPLPLPQTVRYCIGDGLEPYINGRTLSLEVPNAVQRYIPVIIKDFSAYYRVMISVEAENKAFGLSKESQESLPFTITCSNWTDFTISGADAVLFSLDGSPWSEGDGSMQLDRSRDHKVSWKFENESDSKARSFILPAKPALSVLQTKGSSPVTIRLSNPAFTFKKASDKASPPSSFWYADSIPGEHLNTDVSVEVYFWGIRQGVLSASISIDKKPPLKPVFEATSTSFYARESVTVQIKSDEQVFYAVSEPTISNFGFSDLEITSQLTNGNANHLNYAPYKKSSFILSEYKEGAVLYSLHAYAEDRSGNKSEYESFSVVVDGYNYYVNSFISADYISDGSPARPFTEMKDIVKLLNQKNYARLHITGKFNNVPSLTFTKDCDIIGVEGAQIQFASESEIHIENAVVSISGCIIEKHNDNELPPQDADVFQKRLIFVNNGSLYLDNVDIIFTAFRNASLMQTSSSTIRIQNSALTLHALSYASGITSVSSIIGCIASSVSVIAPASVAFSASKGSLIVDSSSVIITSDLARVAEVSSSMYLFTNNSFSSVPLSMPSTRVSQKKTVQPVWADYSSVQKAYANNTVTGF